ncbi:MAG: valine--tRNA ligase, partial [Bradymonadaceae bacterium]
ACCTATSGWSTGIPRARPSCRAWRSTTRRRSGSSGTCATRPSTGRTRSSSGRLVPRRCSGTPPSPSIPTTTTTPTSSAKRSACRWSAGRSPSSDENDFECGKRHDLERIQVIGFDAEINENAPERYQGLDRYEAREQVVADLEEEGLLEGVEDREYAPGRSDRTGAVVEPLPLEQWFVDTEPLAKPAIEAVESGETDLFPPQWKKTFDHFMYN